MIKKLEKNKAKKTKLPFLDSITTFQLENSELEKMLTLREGSSSEEGRRRSRKRRGRRRGSRESFFPLLFS